MPGQHARLSPSDAERWISCPAAIGMDARHPVPHTESSYAREGTAAHALAEIKASFHFGQITERQYKTRLARWRRTWHEFADQFDEMDEHTDAYVALVQERFDLYPNSVVFFEQRLKSSVPQSGGTSDTVIVSPVHVEIIDFKYGAGVAVGAHGNPQLRLYGDGALLEYGDLLGQTELVRVTVHQPRMNHVLTEEITADALRAWISDVVMPRADLALNDPDAPFGPSETACRWCPHSGRCQAQVEAVFADAPFDEKPETLSAQDMADLYARKKQIEQWLAALEAAVLDAAYSKGITVPGYKVVLSGGQRKVMKPDLLAETLASGGYSQDDYMTTKPKGIGDLESLLGKEFKTLLEDSGIVSKTDGKPAVVPESDRRPAINPNTEAAKAFGTVED